MKQNILQRQLSDETDNIEINETIEDIPHIFLSYDDKEQEVSKMSRENSNSVMLSPSAIVPENVNFENENE